MSNTIATHIEPRANRDGRERAYIDGTRVRVQDIVALAEIQGRTADQIVTAVPHLSLSQVHAALSYYFDHRAEIQQEMREDEELARQLKILGGPGPLERRLKTTAGPTGDTVSS